jgi:two-component system LytT family response regulator
MAENGRLRVVVVDDEPLGRRRVEDALRSHPDVEVAGTAGDGQTAVDVIRQQQPDLVFLDVQMPRMTGLDVARALGEEMPLTIFITAYDRHAVEAFDLAATDYLVKPFDDERFDQALARARSHLALQSAGRVRERLLAVLRDELPAAPPPTNGSEPEHREHAWIERIPVESRGEVRFIPVSEVEAIVSDGPYAELVTADRRHLIRETMTALEGQLDPERFFRIHRSTIVALDRVDTLLRGAGGDYEVRLKNGARLAVARSRRAELADRLGIRR